MRKSPFVSLLFFSQTNRPYAFFLLLSVLIGLAACRAENSSSGSESKTSTTRSGDAYSGNDVETVEKIDALGNIERYSRRLDDYAKEGPYQLISPEGNILESAQYKNDTLHGMRVLFFETGDTQIVENYTRGVFVGPYRAYYEDGGLELTGEYVANTMEGSWKRFYKDGQLMEEVQFQDNLENGPFLEYHPNGKMKAEGYYKDGDNEHGLLKLYDEEGELTKTMNCQHGVCRTVWEKGQEES